jgi:hypothetical protein
MSLHARTKPIVMKIKFAGSLESDQVAGYMTQRKHLPLGEPLKICEHGHGLLPVVAHPRERVKRKSEVVSPNRFQQMFGTLARATRVCRQFRAVAGDVGSIGRFETGP